VPLLKLKGSEHFLTLNSTTYFSEWQQASQINIYDHDGEMYHIKSKHVDQFITPDHKV